MHWFDYCYFLRICLKLFGERGRMFLKVSRICVGSQPHSSGIVPGHTASYSIKKNGRAYASDSKSLR